jgi:uncharacterized protein YbjT (DUF2867 family)
MNYVITGSIGHISKPIVEQLSAGGHTVTVITSKEDRKAEIEKLGAKAAVGSVDDLNFLKQTFTGADAVYTMVPPHWGAADWKKYIAGIGANYAEAIKSAGVKKVVNLSSIGAHMPDGCGPVSGLYHVESALNALEGVDVVHLRPGFFFYNFLGNVGMVKNMGIIGSNYEADTDMVLADTSDIADHAVKYLSNPDFTGKSTHYVVSDERKPQQIAHVLGNAVGKPELPWIGFKDEDALGGMTQMGLSHEVARNYVEMGVALRSGEMGSDYRQNGKGINGKRKLEDFAPVFASVYSQS